MLVLKIISFVGILAVAAVMGAIPACVLTVCLFVVGLFELFMWIYYALFPEMKQFRHVLTLKDFESIELR